MRRTTRIYVPTTLTGLAGLHRRGELTSRLAHFVTPEVRASYPDDDEADLAYLAYRNAARDSLLLLREDPGAPRRRVVIAADLTVEADPPSGSGSAVPLDSPVSRRAVASIHIDGAGAEGEVAAAVNALPAAGGPDTGPAVAAVEEHELEWYDVSELPQLVD